MKKCFVTILCFIVFFLVQGISASEDFLITQKKSLKKSFSITSSEEIAEFRVFESVQNSEGKSEFSLVLFQLKDKGDCDLISYSIDNLKERNSDFSIVLDVILFDEDTTYRKPYIKHPAKLILIGYKYQKNSSTYGIRFMVYRTPEPMVGSEVVKGTITLNGEDLHRMSSSLKYKKEDEIMWIAPDVSIDYIHKNN